MSRRLAEVGGTWTPGSWWDRLEPSPPLPAVAFEPLSHLAAIAPQSKVGANSKDCARCVARRGCCALLLLLRWQLASVKLAACHSGLHRENPRAPALPGLV